MQELVIFFYVLAAGFLVLLAGLWRCDMCPFVNGPYNPPPAPPMPIFETMNNHDEYMVIMGCDKAREWMGLKKEYRADWIAAVNLVAVWDAGRG